MESNALILPRTLDKLSKEFRYVDETHTYFLGERKLPSITGILRMCGYVDTQWYTEEARSRGSHVHLAIKFLNKQTLDWSSVIDRYIGYVMAYEKFVRDWNFKIGIFELPLYHPDLLFGGTPDLVGTCLENVPCIVELKTGPVMKWTALQTAAQELLIRAWDGPEIRRRRWGVTLNADGTYSKPKEFLDFNRDETVFRMLNTAVQTLGEKTEPVFKALGLLTPDELKMIGVGPLIQSVIEHRELYAA